LRSVETGIEKQMQPDYGLVTRKTDYGFVESRHTGNGIDPVWGVKHKVARSRMTWNSEKMHSNALVPS